MSPLTELSSAIIRRIEEWKQRLIDLTRRNRLLYFQPTKSSSLNIHAPDFESIFEHLYKKEKTWQFWLPPLALKDLEEESEGSSTHSYSHWLYENEVDNAVKTPARTNELVCENMSRKQLESKLKSLFRRAKSDYQERGVRVLYLAFGTLVWKDENTLSDNVSPLILCPVDLWRTSAADPFQLSWAEEDLVLNPALVTKLRQDFRIELPALSEDFETQTLEAYFSQVTKKVKPLDWRVENTTYLGLFSFHKLAIYQDLTSNGEEVSQNMIVRGLAGESLDRNILEPIPALNEIDNISKPAETYQIRDADSSQQQAIQAALRGHNIVLHGPPGTGKSQTIANIISEFLARGKSILFVSEKMAALEVVYKRLEEAHLHDFCLELHSHKANKREVIQNLKAALDTALLPQKLPKNEDYERLQQIREHVNEYVKALHRVHHPINLSTREILEKVSGLHDVPYVPWVGPAFEDLTLVQVAEKAHLIKELSDYWEVVTEGENFPWYGCREESKDLQRRILIEQLLESCLAKIADLVASADDFATEIGVKIPHTFIGTAWLVEVGKHLNQSPAPNASWLQTDEFDVLSKDAAYYLEVSTNYWREYYLLLNEYSESCLDNSFPTWQSLNNLWQEINALSIGRNDLEGLSLVENRIEIIDFLNNTISFIDEAREYAELVKTKFDLPITTVDIAELKRITTLATFLIELSEKRDKPEPQWFTPYVIEEVERNIQRLLPQYKSFNEKKDTYNARRQCIMERFDESIFSLDLNKLIEAFSGVIYRSPFRFLWPAYHRDKRVILNVSRSTKLPSSIEADLFEARELVRLEAELIKQKPTAVAIFGRYDEAEETDFERLKMAVDAAKEVLRLTHNSPTKAIIDLVSQFPFPVEFRKAIEHFQQLILERDADLESLSEIIPSDPFHDTKESFQETPIERIAVWAEKSRQSMKSFNSAISSLYHHRKDTRTVDLSQLLDDIASRERMQAWKESMAVESERLQKEFGQRYSGLTTSWSEILAALEWTGRMRDLFQQKGIPLSGMEKFIDQCTRKAEETPRSDLLIARYQIATDAIADLQNHFIPPSPRCNGKPLSQCSFSEMEEKLSSLLESLDDLKLWVDYKQFLGRLDSALLMDFVKAFQKSEIGSEQLVPAFYNAFFQGWLSKLYSTEQILQNFRTKSHEEVIREFRETDEKLIKLASQSVIERCDKNRPTSSYLSSASSEEAILRRESMKRRRHLPVRSLFQSIPNLIQKLKPCLMMSPLSVSQYLPPDKSRFDLLIFDEASQIFTEDAIGAVYRASQIIVAGDNKQMPPTDFFRTSDFDGDDGDSIVDDSNLKVASSADYSSVLDEIQTIDGVGTQHLRWHYRSRHESLIAFSNNRFYENKLVTFPSAQERNTNLGVKFIYVKDGIYDRGGKRNNLREAEVVADYVFEHFTNFPTKSLGVVAFSQAQMIAIEDEIERRRILRPEFEDYFKEDRLEGFFIKNLENVQGDERDVIFFSVGYGRDPQGRLTMNFGPLNRDGGERRLNVAITRAREKVLLISSIKAGDIDLTGPASAGVLNFHRYLDYASRGIEALTLDAPQGLGEAESPLEEDIASEIRRLGYDVIPQVGCSGYRVDMGVLDPAQPGKFILGIEADGATYHSAYTARDRDRLRQQVLENLGWRIHRIWSPDWIAQRQTEIKRLKLALEESKNSNNFFLSSSEPIEEKHVEYSDIVRQERVVIELEKPPEASPYRTALIKRGAFYGWEFHDALNEDTQADLLSQIVAIEGPVHIEIASRRLIPGWYLEKVTGRVVSTIGRIARLCEHRQSLRVVGDFLWSREALTKVSDLMTFPVRVPEPTQPESRRDIKFIASEEVQAAILLIVKHALSIESEALMAETRKLFGFSRSGESIRTRLVKEITTLQKQKQIQTLEGKVSLVKKQ